MDGLEIVSTLYNKSFFEKMCKKEVELTELKKFVALKQHQNLNDKINKRLKEISSKFSLMLSHIYEKDVYKNMEMVAEYQRELTTLNMVNKMLTTVDYKNLDRSITTIDICNIILNEEENCDIIVGQATEDELKSYVYELMKQFEEDKNKQKVK